MGGKLDTKWDGPYTVEAKLSKERYQLKSKNGLVLKKLYCSCLLKEYFEKGNCMLDKREMLNHNASESSPPFIHVHVIQFTQKTRMT